MTDHMQLKGHQKDTYEVTASTSHRNPHDIFDVRLKFTQTVLKLFSGRQNAANHPSRGFFLINRTKRE